MDKKKILLFGKGFLGSNIVLNNKKNNYKITSTHKAGKEKNDQFSLDIFNISTIEKIILKTNPDFIINCIARGDIDFLEKDLDLAMKVNCYGVSNIAKIAKENKIRMLHISTDSIFDGKRGNYVEEDIPNPINNYAKSKYAGEKEIMKSTNDYVIIRTNFFGLDQRGNYLFNWILNNVKKSTTMYGFSDVIFSPLNIDCLSKMILELLEIKFKGIIHLSSDKVISKHDFILEILKNLGFTLRPTKPTEHEQ